MANFRTSSVGSAAGVLDALAEPEPTHRDIGLELDATDRMYIVAEDDTLSSIARKFYGRSSARWRILEANRHLIRDPYFVAPGWRLRIPA